MTLLNQCMSYLMPASAAKHTWPRVVVITNLMQNINIWHYQVSSCPRAFVSKKERDECLRTAYVSALLQLLSCSHAQIDAPGSLGQFSSHWSGIKSAFRARNAEVFMLICKILPQQRT